MRWIALWFALLMAGCSQPPPQPAASAAPEVRHQLRGEVVSINRQEKSIRVKHEEIKGWMDAMTMDFPVPDQTELDKLKPGDRITATVLVRDLDYHLAEIRVEAKP